MYAIMTGEGARSRLSLIHEVSRLLMGALFDARDQLFLDALTRGRHWISLQVSFLFISSDTES